MGFKDLFINGDESNENEKVEPKATQTKFESKFPTSGPIETKTETATPVATPPTKMAPITPTNPACAPHLDKIMGLYEEGFNGLNLDGYDFFEYFQSVVKTGINNPAMYEMALTMGKAMDPTVTKETLIKQSEFYITEIEKVYKHYVDNGTTKREEALKSKGNEEASLAKELESINGEITRLNQLKSQKQTELSTIDGKYTPVITDVECKLMANDMARERILGTITSVVTGIKNNI